MTHATPSRRTLRSRYRRVLKHLESLESRTLLSVNITTYNIPSVAPAAAVYDPSGNLWVFDTNYSVVVDPSDPTLNYFGGALERFPNGNLSAAPDMIVRMDPALYQPMYFAAGSNGHVYCTDFTGGYAYVDDVNTADGTIVQTRINPDWPEMPNFITVTHDGGVWFTATDFMGNLPYPNETSYVHRMDPMTYDIATYTIQAPTDPISFSHAIGISANPDGSVWVGLPGQIIQDGSGWSVGPNRFARASFADGTINFTSYDVNSGTAADTNNAWGGMAADGQGGLWYALDNPGDPATYPTPAPDQLVHAYFDNGQLVQDPFVVTGATVDNPLQLQWLSVDTNGTVWFDTYYNNQLGSFDGTTFTFYSVENAGFLNQTAASPVVPQITVLGWGDDYEAGVPIVQVDNVITPPVITFEGEAYNVNIKEDVVLNSTLLATFIAPTPAAAYSATITWGDGTTTDVTPTFLGDNTYAVVVSGKSFATQGTYAGAIAVKDGTTAIGSLAFTSSVSDVALNVTSFNVTPLILRIAAATGTFTDDADLATSTWTATIKWGDNTTSTGLIVRDPTQAGRYLVIGLHQYRARGTYTARLTVTTTETAAAILNATLTTTVTVR
jgi:streptogramin lyase